MITKDTDYAIRALQCIAVKKNKIVTVCELSEKLGMPCSFLRKILQILNKKGILQSCKGRGGGFCLNIPVNKISVLALMEIFQGPFHLYEHVFKGKNCPDIRGCYLKKRLDAIQKKTAKELSSISIAKIIKNKKKDS
ncbi:MAG: Rrf2 family transcriptional regulator [Candidatus Omnitrophica bacterium]|nr:Rrf2 family transcriptional regulator [Candidatus Omnitrophota bacterium]